jgi:SAM-dependent methyltransferase
MKANVSRRSRFAFDRVAEEYDRGRPVFGDSIVQSFLRHAGLSPGALVLEIGAGTGQLTLGLLRAGLRVHAIEPGQHLGDRLRARVAPDAHLEVFSVPFEEYEGDERYCAVFAANSFHWLDPAVSYSKAHDSLRAAGALCTLWNFPIAADPEVQGRATGSPSANRFVSFSASRRTTGTKSSGSWAKARRSSPAPVCSTRCGGRSASSMRSSLRPVMFSS